jgi:hypothetical protein
MVCASVGCFCGMLLWDGCAFADAPRRDTSLVLCLGVKIEWLLLGGGKVVEASVVQTV